MAEQYSVFIHTASAYSCICWWAFRSCPCLGYCEQCCGESRVRVSFCPDRCLRRGIVGSYGNSVFSFFKGPLNCFSQWLCQFTSPHRAPGSAHPLLRFFVAVLAAAMLPAVRRHLIVVCVRISPVISDAVHLSCASWPSVCLFWRNVYLDLLPIFWIGCLFFVVGLHELLTSAELLLEECGGGIGGKETKDMCR